MATTPLRYRGVPYEAGHHELPSEQPVEHTYRGTHYQAPLRHEVVPPDPDVELHYRGSVYHHRAREAARQVAEANGGDA